MLNDNCSLGLTISTHCLIRVSELSEQYTLSATCSHYYSIVSILIMTEDLIKKPNSLQMVTKIRTPSVSVLPLCLFYIRKCFKSVNIIFLPRILFFLQRVLFFLQTTEYPDSFFFSSVIFQWDRKYEILNVVSANLFLLLFPSFYPFCFLAWFFFICFFLYFMPFRIIYNFFSLLFSSYCLL